jgi:hypothetical protein
MPKFWHSTPAMKTLALVLLALALAVIAAVHFSSQKMIAIQGPGALQQVSPDRLWLGVNNDLWTLDATGHKLAHKTAQELGLIRAVSVIAPGPDGEVLLASRNLGTWTIARASDMAVLRTITPQWPAEFKGNLSNALHIAVSASWDIAVALGGGHTVLLFDKDGRFKAKTIKGAYYFTNGLWSDAQGWWTTDTNKFFLRLMDSETLAEKQSIALNNANPGYPWLAEMVASKGAPKPGTTQAPVATLSQVDSMMESGYVVDVFADGSQLNYTEKPLARINDMTWLNDTLLVVDGGAYRLLRFSAQRGALADFGDAEVQRGLLTMQEDRRFWNQLSSRYMFLLAAALLLLGMGAYSRHKKLAVSAMLLAREPIVVGTPVVSASLAFKQWGIAVGLPLLVRIAAVGLCFYGVFFKALLYGSKLGGAGPLLLALTTTWVLVLPVFLVAVWQQWHYQKYARKPEYEGTLNRKAMAWLQDHTEWDAVKEPGEAVRETLVLRGKWLGLRQQWLLVTNQRVLLFAANARERGLDMEWPRSAVVFAGLPEHDPAGGKAPGRLMRCLVPQPNILIRLRGGEVLTGISPSAVTAMRAAQLLMQSRQAIVPVDRLWEEESPVLTAQPRKRHWYQVVASFMLPGFGQWLQDRFVTGTVFFTAAALLIMVGVGPVLWAMSGPKTHVDFLTKLTTMYIWLLLATVSAVDAFYFARSKLKNLN